MTFADMPIVLLAFGAYEEFAASSSAAGFYLWLPDASDFRTTPYFKTLIRNTGALAYWREKGFPDFCRAQGDDDFECDQLDQ